MSQDRQLTDAIKATIRADYAKIKADIPGFRSRPAQAEMMAEVARALSTEGGAILVDAPTGIGKSMAYLLSAIPVALAQSMKLVISTGSVALQQQLIEKDLPLYQKHINPELRTCIAKGRSRYACPRNLMELTGMSRQATFDGMESEGVWSRPPKAGEIEIVQKLASELSEARWDGDIDKAPVEVPAAIRQMITTTAASCSGQRCAFAGVCPFIKARAELEVADVVVANHALVMADFMFDNEQGGKGGVILPSPGTTLYVFDEGHHLEHAAIESSAQAIVLSHAAEQLKKHDRPLRAAFRQLGNDKVAGANLESALSDIALYKQALNAMEHSLTTFWQPEPGLYDPSWTAPLGVLPDSLRDQAVQLAALSNNLERIARGLREAVLKGGLSDGMTDKLNRDLGFLMDFFDCHHMLWHAWQCRDDELSTPTARWISMKGRALHCHASPISAKDILNESLWPSAGGVLITSATLAIGESFANIRQHLGVPARAKELRLQSPFDIAGNGQLLIPWISATPSESDRHNAAVTNWLVRDHAWNKGGLVLFTSKRKMMAVYDALPEVLKASIKLQSDGVNKAQMLEMHRTDIEQGRGSTLFGLESLGTGVDLAGSLCTTVVITQLPFSVPSDPVGMTRAAHCTKQGGSPFHDLTIPQTIRTMTQYAGRLLRTETDIGQVVLLDRRIVNSAYGRRILNALPPFALKVNPPPVPSPFSQDDPSPHEKAN